MAKQASKDTSTVVAVDPEGRLWSIPAGTPQAVLDAPERQWSVIGEPGDGFRPPRRRAKGWEKRGIEGTIVVADASGNYISIPDGTPDDEIAGRGWTRIEARQVGDPGGPVTHDAARTRVLDVPVMTVGTGDTAASAAGK